MFESHNSKHKSCHEIWGLNSPSKAVGTHHRVEARGMTLPDISRHSREEELVWDSLRVGARRKGSLASLRGANGHGLSKCGCRIGAN